VQQSGHLSHMQLRLPISESRGRSGKLIGAGLRQRIPPLQPVLNQPSGPVFQVRLVGREQVDQSGQVFRIIAKFSLDLRERWICQLEHHISLSLPRRRQSLLPSAKKIIGDQRETLSAISDLIESADKNQSLQDLPRAKNIDRKTLSF